MSAIKFRVLPSSYEQTAKDRQRRQWNRNLLIGLEAAQRQGQAGARVPPQVLAIAAGPDEKKVVAALEIPGPNPDHRFDDHISQQVEPEAAEMILRQWPHATVSLDRARDKRAVMETA